MVTCQLSSFYTSAHLASTRGRATLQHQTERALVYTYSAEFYMGAAVFAVTARRAAQRAASAWVARLERSRSTRETRRLEVLWNLPVAEYRRTGRDERRR
jgi:hypothetical protein